jgi:hypothetical protein
METPLVALARDPKFIPLVYDYCDLWCEHCPVTSRCLLVAADRQSPRGDGRDNAQLRLQLALALARAVIECSSAAQKPIARLDLALCDVSTAPREPALGHPLEFLARHYALQAGRFLRSVSPSGAQPPRGSALEVVAWYHFMIAAKTYRALVSHFASDREPDLLPDALGSAKAVLVAIDRSQTAWRSIASTSSMKDDATIGGLIELLEALATGVEMRFPEARAFIRPGLDDGAGGSLGVSAYAQPSWRAP